MTLAILEQPNLAYDYTQIADSETRTLAQRAAQDIKPRLRRATQDIIVIGQRLHEVRERLPHGQWLPWIETEFDMAETTARNFMRVSSRFDGKSAIIADLTPTALYALAAPSTPEDAIIEVEQHIEAGSPPTVAETKQIIASHKPAQPAQNDNLDNDWSGDDWTTDKALVDWTDGDWANHNAKIEAAIADAADEPNQPINQSPVPPSDNSILSPDQPDPVAPAQTEEETQAQRLRILTNALTQSLMLLHDANAQTAEDYGFGIEFDRLISDAMALEIEFKQLTPADRINS